MASGGEVAPEQLGSVLSVYSQTLSTRFQADTTSTNSSSASEVRTPPPRRRARGRFPLGFVPFVFRLWRIALRTFELPPSTQYRTQPY